VKSQEDTVKADPRVWNMGVVLQTPTQYREARTAQSDHTKREQTERSEGKDSR